MRTLGRIALGALAGYVTAVVLSVSMIVALEVAYDRGFRYDDLDLAYASYAIFVAAPIIGGWWMWVRR